MLTDTEKQIIDMAGADYKYRGARELDIKASFGNVTSYYMRLNLLLDTPAAHAYDPHTVARLRAARTTRVRRGQA